jgi:hypothetical protein
VDGAWGAGFSALPAEFRGSAGTTDRDVLQMRRISGRSVTAPLASLLPQPKVSLNVLRAAVPLIALTLAAGPSADLLCGIWCHPVNATALACLHQETTTPQATSSDDCTEVRFRAIAFVREDVRRGARVPDDSFGADTIPPFAFAPSAESDRWSTTRAGGLVLEARPRRLPLRI